LHLILLRNRLEPDLREARRSARLWPAKLQEHIQQTNQNEINRRLPMHPTKHNTSSSAAKKTWTEPVIHKIDLNAAKHGPTGTNDGQGGGAKS